jgi:LysM repeat protein
MKFRGVLFLLANIAITAAVAFGVVTLLNSRTNSANGENVPLVTVPVVITQTPGPTQTPWIVTVTVPAGQVILPTGLVGTLSPAAQASAVAGGGNSVTTLLNPNAGTVQPDGSTALPPNCIIHVIESGDTPFAIAQEYGVSGFDVMAANGLTDDTAALLQIGQQLVIPLEGCPLTAADLATATPLPQPTDETSAEPTSANGTAVADTTRPAQSPTPTVTLAPTAANANVAIVQIINGGDVTSEGVEIRNNGGVVDLAGWTLTDAQGNTFTFPQQRVFTGGSVTVYTRGGQANTAVNVFWGRDQAVWEAGDVATLRDEDGAVQSTFRVPSTQGLP